MKSRFWVLPAVVLGGGMSADAMASDSSLSYSELERLLDQAGGYGFTRFEKFDVDDDDNAIEFEGWRDDGWELDISMQLDSGDMTRESQRKSSTPDWSLNGDELHTALNRARDRGMQRFEELEVDSDGHIEIEGYNAANDEFDLDMHRDDLTDTGETG